MILLNYDHANTYAIELILSLSKYISCEWLITIYMIRELTMDWKVIIILLMFKIL
jgi:hypothetical protein